MNARHAATLIWITTLLLTPASAAPPAQKLLVLCSADTCEFKRIAMLFAAGRPSVRGLPIKIQSIGPTELKQARELRLEQVSGFFRDTRTGAFYALGPDGKPREVIVPFGFGPKTALAASAAWQGTALEYTDSPSSKSKTPILVESFAFVIVASDLDRGALDLAQRQIEDPDADPRRIALIRGAVQFAGQSAVMQRWRETLVTTMRDDVKRFDDQSGDPTTLGSSIREAAQLRSTYLQIATGQNAELLATVASEDDLYSRRLMIADSLRKAGFWDEYLAKLNQLGLAKWSVPDILPNLRAASTASSQSHLQSSKQFAETGRLDRSFDEAAIAAHASCEPSVSTSYYNARVLFVTGNQVASSAAYTGRSKALLDQTVRELEVLDPSKEQLTLDRIAQGEALDPNFLPLQWKKADFLDKLGRYSEALEVVRRIERNVRLDPKELEVCLTLDGRIRNNLTDSVQKSLAEARKQFDLARYQLALDAASKGLRADPLNPSLLRVSALSAAFLRDRTAAIRSIQQYLRGANVSCAETNETEQILELFRVLDARASTPASSSGIPHWISGVRYPPGEVFYDPLSMGFLQPISLITSKDGVSTGFAFEDRSYLVRSITTQLAHTLKTAASPLPAVSFEVEPKYDRTSLSMVEIGPRGSPGGERTPNVLTYLNSPGVDPDLVFRFTGRQIARGWAGNPFFHPFIWNGLYFFDLTYDRMGRLSTATPIRESAGARVDPFSEPLQFTWDGNSKRLLSIRGTRSGYLRELEYDKEGRLRAEKIAFPRGSGSIRYEYSDSILTSAKSEDNFYDKRERLVQFDVGQRTR